MNDHGEHIGEWVYRQRRVRRTRDHLVESQIEDRFVTRCGRHMRPLAGAELLLVAQPTDPCARCS